MKARLHDLVPGRDLHPERAMIEALKVGYRTYSVESMDPQVADDEGRWGDINHRLGRIRIQDALPAPRYAFTLVHEVLHALFQDVGLDWSHEDEEKMVERLTPRLCAFLTDNPDQVRTLLGMLQARDLPARVDSGDAE